MHFHRGESGELCMGERRLAEQQSMIPTSVISIQSIHLGVPATASNAFSTGSLFIVCYKPRFTGTVVGVEDVSSQWTDSKWRCLKVQWDEATNILRPDRVSPWEIEPFNSPAPVLNALQLVLVRNKRPRLPMDIADLLLPQLYIWKCSVDRQE